MHSSSRFGHITQLINQRITLMIFILISFKLYWWRKRAYDGSNTQIWTGMWYVINNNSFISFFSPCCHNGNNYVFTFVIFESSIIVCAHTVTHTHTKNDRKYNFNVDELYCYSDIRRASTRMVYQCLWTQEHIFGNANSFSNYLFNDLCVIRRRRKKKLPTDK